MKVKMIVGRAFYTVILLLWFSEAIKVQAGTQYQTYNNYTYCIEEDGNIKIVGYIGNEEVVEVPSQINGIPVRYIESLGKFETKDLYDYANENTKKVIVPDGVVSVGAINGKSARGCNIEEVILPDSVTEIAKDSFDHCQNLKTVRLPSGLKEIPEGAFAFCSELKSIQLPVHLKSIGRDAFFECRSLTEIRIPDSTVSIGADIFCECVSLKKVTLSKNLTVISEGAFYGCSKLKSIQIPQKVRRIEDEAFLHTPMTKVTIPKNVTWIGKNVFWTYPGRIKKVVIKSKKLKHIGREAFSPKSGAVYDVPDRCIKKYKQMLIKKKCFKQGKMKIK